MAYFKVHFNSFLQKNEEHLLVKLNTVFLGNKTSFSRFCPVDDNGSIYAHTVPFGTFISKTYSL